MARVVGKTRNVFPPSINKHQAPVSPGGTGELVSHPALANALAVLR